MQIKRNSVAFILISLIFVAFVAYGAFTTYKATAQSNGSNPEDLPATASYVIKTDGVDVWAVRYDGEVVSNNTDAREVIQYAINALSTEGGLIFISRGTYEINSSIIARNHLTLMGEGSATILKIKNNTDLGIFGIVRLWYDFADVQILNLAFDGNKANGGLGYCFYVRRITNLKVSDCVFYNFTETVLKYWSASGEPVSKNHLIENNYFHDNDDTVVYVNADTLGLNQYITIRNNYFTNCLNENGVILFQRVKHGIISNNYICNTGTGNATKQGIRIIYWNSDIVISGNILIDAVNILYCPAIWVGYADRAVISDNLVIFTENPSVLASGIVLEPDIDQATVTGNILIGNDFENIGNGIYLHGTNGTNIDVEKVSIVGNSILGFYGGITVTYSKDCVVDSNAIEARVNGLRAGTSYGILWTNNKVKAPTGVAGVGYNSTFFGNDFTECTTPVNLGGANNLFRYNRNYVTENSGTATLLAGATSVSFEHGLAGTPQIVVHSWKGTVGNSENDSLELYVDFFENTIAGWTEVGLSPYLNNSTANYIYTKNDGAKEEAFHFEDSNGSGTINSVNLYLEIQGSSARDDYVAVDLWDASTWQNVANYDPDNDNYQWINWDVTSILDTWAKIDGTKMNFTYVKQGNPQTEDIYIRRSYLYVDYTGQPPPPAQSWWSANSTHITISTSSSSSVDHELSWCAEYKP